MAHGGVSVWLFPSWQSDTKAYEQSLCLRCLCVMVWFCLSLVDMSASVCDFAGCVSVPMCRRFCLCLDRCACVCVCFVGLHSVCITVCVCACTSVTRVHITASARKHRKRLWPVEACTSKLMHGPHKLHEAGAHRGMQPKRPTHGYKLLSITPHSTLRFHGCPER